MEDIAETTDIMMRTMDQLMQREENLEILAMKSQDLSAQSKVLMKRSKELNRCGCVIL
jgi:hypothetical protein